MKSSAEEFEKKKMKWALRMIEMGQKQHKTGDVTKLGERTLRR